MRIVLALRCSIYLLQFALLCSHAAVFEAPGPCRSQLSAFANLDHLDDQKFLQEMKDRSTNPHFMDGGVRQLALLQELLNRETLLLAWKDELAGLFYALTSRSTSPRYALKASALLQSVNNENISPILYRLKLSLLPEFGRNLSRVPSGLWAPNPSRKSWTILEKIMGAGDLMLKPHVLRRVFAFISLHPHLGQKQKFYLAQNLIEAVNRFEGNTREDGIYFFAPSPQPRDGTLLVCGHDCDYFFAISPKGRFFSMERKIKSHGNPNGGTPFVVDDWETEAKPDYTEAVLETW